MVLLDLSHTSHTAARTGVQRVCRAVAQALPRQTAVEPVTYDPYLRAWRRLNRYEHSQLAAGGVARRRRAQWPLRTRWQGRLQRWLGQAVPHLPGPVSAVLLPEIFSPAVAAALPALRATGAPIVALFHDAIALRLPEYSPPKTVARFPAYLQELTQCDGIAAVSEDSRQALIDYWQWLGVTSPPPVVALPLGTEPAPPAAADCHVLSDKPVRPVVLCVGSVEGRKNHLSLLSACEQLWQEGREFELHVIGLPRPETAQPALDRLRALQQAGRPLQFAGAVDDETLVAAYRRCDFTVYPSLMEGFGLPVIESLQHGRPCICSAHGALGESARRGGCLPVEQVDAESLATAIARLLEDGSLRAELSRQANSLSFRNWDDYSRELLAWIGTLSPRA